MRDLKDTVAWITGAGTGIGEGAAVAMARDGAKVILTGRRKDPLERVSEKITNAGGFVEIAQGDALDRSGMMTLARDIKTHHGKLDLLFNNHGINITNRNWGGGNLDGWDEVIDVNVKGAYNLSLIHI